MADLKDVSRAIHSALEEIGVSGHLNVEMDGNQTVAAIGDLTGNDIEVRVIVCDEVEHRRAA